MKPFAKRLLALASAAAITLSIIPTLHAVETEQQTWARLAPAAEQLPARAAVDPIAAPLTRLGMSQLLMEGYRTITGITDEELGEHEMMFLDTEDTDVLNAYSLDLVSGRSAGIYDPMAGVSRQDYFTACTDLLESVGYPYVDDIELDLEEYADATTERGKMLLDTICKQMGFDSLGYQTLDGLLEAIGLDRDKVCTYCWTGEE